MNKRIATLLTIMVVFSSTQAANQTMIWGDSTQILKQFKQAHPFKKQGILPVIQGQQSDYQLQLKKEASNSSQHARYQITYKGLPVWGYQLVFHSKNGVQDSVTGLNITGIEKDVSTIQGNYTAEQIEQQILKGIKEEVKFKKNTTVIFIDKDKKAHLAYHVSFYINTKAKPIQAPNYLVDANSGEVLKQWDEVRSVQVGQGLGGNAFPLPYRSGMFQHGDALPGLPSLGKFDVTLQDGQCLVANDMIKVMSFENLGLGYDIFPITVIAENLLKLNAFTYPCTSESLFLNYADGTSGPINYSFSPVNDTMYFAQKTLEMYEQIYGVDKPIGDDLPLRAYTHLGNMDNAFAIPTIKFEGEIFVHQQIVIGNGERFLTAPAQSVLGHELSHNFTDINSGLIYKEQPGGINESFSDMAAIALLDYLRKDFPWYWDGEDWSIGREAVISGIAIRYLDDPTKDGISIDNASNYTDDLDVHVTSGVFNKAFYLLAHKPNWSIQQAFQVMVDANMHYWSPIAYYDFAACGVIQAALDRDLDKAPVIEAFAEVGVVCPMHKG